MKNTSTSHIKANVKMNEPKPNGISAKVEAHFLGIVHTRLVEELDQFVKSENIVFKDEDSRYTQIYVDVNIKMCDDVAKAEEVWNYLNDGPLVKAKEELKRKEENARLKTSLNGNNLSIKFYNQIRNRSGVSLPDELQNGLRDID